MTVLSVVVCAGYAGLRRIALAEPRMGLPRLMRFASLRFAASLCRRSVAIRLSLFTSHVLALAFASHILRFLEFCRASDLHIPLMLSPSELAPVTLSGILKSSVAPRGSHTVRYKARHSPAPGTRPAHSQIRTLPPDCIQSQVRIAPDSSSMAQENNCVNCNFLLTTRLLHAIIET